jgi:hypothetical protein
LTRASGPSSSGHRAAPLVFPFLLVHDALCVCVCV